MPETPNPMPGTDRPSSAEPCGLGRRLMVMFYDAVAVVALMMAVTALLLFTPLRDQTAFIDPAPTALMLLTWFLYLARCWRKGGVTLGMRAWRCKLVFDDGKAPGWGKCLARFAVSLVSTAAAGLGFAWSLFDPLKRTWHDKACGSRLIRLPKTSNRSS